MNEQTDPILQPLPPEAPTLNEIAAALDSLAEAVVQYDLMEFISHNSTFWRDAAEVLRRKA